MEVVIVKNPDDVAVHAAKRIVEFMIKKPDVVLGLATGNTPIALYERLVAIYNEGKLSFQDATTFNLDEYIGIEPSNPQSYRSFMNTHLFEKVDIAQSRTHVPECPPGENPRVIGDAYEQKITAVGGIDLQILGIGSNGHIGFNEPYSSLASRTRVKTLTQQTVADNNRLFASGEFQPQLAITMGIATILEARHILLLATGKQKASCIRKAIEGPVSAMCPASALQMHRYTTVILDEDAASELKESDYYRWVNLKHESLVDEYGYFHND